MTDYSLWEVEAFGATWDVCIVGGGITGLSTGISLLETFPGIRVLILDRWHLPLGASTRNAGFSCFGSPTEMLEDIRNMGQSATHDLIRQRYEGLIKLRSRLDSNKSDYHNWGGYEVYHQEEFDLVMDNLSELNRLAGDAIGQQEVFRNVDVPDGIHGFYGAVFNPFEGQLHPGKMIRQLREIYTGLGGQMITGFDVSEIEDDQHGQAIIRGDLSYPVIARKVVVTTNAFAARLLPGLDVRGARNQVMVTSPVNGLPWKGCFHFDRGYFYFRNIGDRILLGGARNCDPDVENTEAFGFNEVITEALESFLFTHLLHPDQAMVEYRWTGIIGIGPQKLPLIERVSPNVFAGVRLSGMGIALASTIGDKLAAMVWQQ